MGSAREFALEECRSGFEGSRLRFSFLNGEPLILEKESSLLILDNGEEDDQSNVGNSMPF